MNRVKNKWIFYWKPRSSHVSIEPEQIRQIGSFIILSNCCWQLAKTLEGKKTTEFQLVIDFWDSPFECPQWFRSRDIKKAYRADKAAFVINRREVGIAPRLLRAVVIVIWPPHDLASPQKLINIWNILSRVIERNLLISDTSHNHNIVYWDNIVYWFDENTETKWVISSS